MGEIEVVLINLDTKQQDFKQGDPIAKLVAYRTGPDPIKFQTISEADLLKIPSERGVKGFGDASGTVEGEEETMEAHRFS